MSAEARAQARENGQNSGNGAETVSRFVAWLRGDASDDDQDGVVAA